MSKRILCKFFAHGACLKGEYCEFSHDWNDPPNNICTFYQKGVCAFGSRCRYDHVKASRELSIPSSSASEHGLLVSDSVIFGSTRITSNGVATAPALSSFSSPSLHPSVSAWNQESISPSLHPSVSAWNQEPISPSLHPSVSAWNQEPISPSLHPSVSAWNQEPISPSLHPSVSAWNQEPISPSLHPSVSAWNQEPISPSLHPSVPAWNQESMYHDFLEEDVGESRFTAPSERSICSFAAAGNCPRKEKCPYIHGDLCPTCGKHCLHPFRPEEREEHMKTCQKKQKHLEALKRSQEIECSVCLERVLSKPTAAERKFGLLSECDHPFCISCIRNWRSSNPSSGMDVNSTLRTCPICRKLSYFVIPSVIWYSSNEEKQEIIDSYKEKLKSIDCKHFDFGNGSCPFGSSCFYKHAYRDGRLEQVDLRHLGAGDGNTVIAKDIRLSDFLANMHLR